MATRKYQLFSGHFSILSVLFIFVGLTAAQVTFNRQWRRGKYAGEGKADTVDSDEIMFTRLPKSEPRQSIRRIITGFAKHPPSIILNAIDLGEIWKGSNNLPPTLYEAAPQIQQVPEYLNLI